MRRDSSTEAQFKAGLQQLGVTDLPTDDIDGLLEDLDTNGTSTIALAELARSIREAQRDVKAGLLAAPGGGEGDMPPPSPVSGGRGKRAAPRRSKPSGTPVALGTARSAPEVLPDMTPLPPALVTQRGVTIPLSGPLRQTFTKLFDGIQSHELAL